MHSLTPNNHHFRAIRRSLSFCQPAFSLTELLVAIAILGLLVAILIPVSSGGFMLAHRSSCASNQRQIGLALQLFANDNEGSFPQSTHSIRKERAWIFALEPYLPNVDAIRVCPAEPADRQRDILARGATSYVLNDLVVDNIDYHNLFHIPNPSQTLLLCVLSEDRSPSLTRDHIHGDEWTSWPAVLSDIEPDRHRTGKRASDRLSGSSTYLYADGHVKVIEAVELKKQLDAGINPALPPS